MNLTQDVYLQLVGTIVTLRSKQYQECITAGEGRRLRELEQVVARFELAQAKNSVAALGEVGEGNA